MTHDRPGAYPRRTRILLVGLLVAGSAACATDSPAAALSATYSLITVDGHPVPADLEDGFYSDQPGPTRMVNRRLDFRRPDSVAYSGRIEQLVRQADGTLQPGSGFNFCLTAGWTKLNGSTLVLRYPFPPGTRDPWFFVSSDTLYVEAGGVRQVEHQVVAGTSFGTHTYSYTQDPPGSPAVVCPVNQ